MDRLLRHLAHFVPVRTELGCNVAATFRRIHRKDSATRYLLHQQELEFIELSAEFVDVKFSSFLAENSAKWNVQIEYVIGFHDVVVEPEHLLSVINLNEQVEQTAAVFKYDQRYSCILPYLTNRASAKLLEQAVLYDVSATRKYLYQRSKEFRNHNWYIIEPRECLRVGRLYKIQARYCRKNAWQQMRQVYGLPAERPHRRVFLNRHKRLDGRYLANEEEVMAMLQHHGFKIVLAEYISIKEQAKLFQGNGHLVALNGAELVQMFFYESAIQLNNRGNARQLFNATVLPVGIRHGHEVLQHSGGRPHQQR